MTAASATPDVVVVRLSRCSEPSGVEGSPEVDGSDLGGVSGAQAVERLTEAFDAEVHIHHADRSAAPFATHVLRGIDPVDLGDGITAIPTPGHTAGHVRYLVDEQVLFTGDSLERLAEHEFTKVVPTHGVMSSTLPADDLRDRLRALVAGAR